MVVLPSSIKISILLWNVWLLPAPISYEPAHRARLISPLLGGHDVVVLNEAFTYKEMLQEHSGYNYSVTLDDDRVEPRNFSVVDSGLMILSKHPFDKVAKEVYVSTGGIDRLASKGVIMITVTVNGIKIDIYATHMQSGPSSTRKW